eukprot:CAMPEP_0179010462 /NCGR_PEP_ID=MMETSP0796-20121207/124_1 /TAXON_ID=73915 /ORGANISM="Pyrodinium bahamense, Strain pbaha01" /LENGTH=81 /DNA_ID=CAMNT_0020705737 /DNA_START=566 /DNA_END=808 /DNA_ORIENTATION=-
MTWTSFAKYAWFKSLNCLPSLAQPGVSAFGYHQSNSFIPGKESSVTIAPVSSLTLKAGNSEPTAGSPTARAASKENTAAQA